MIISHQQSMINKNEKIINQNDQGRDLKNAQMKSNIENFKKKPILDWLICVWEFFPYQNNYN